MASQDIATATVTGNLTRDPELNESGKVLKLGIASGRRVKQQSGEYEEETSYFDIKVLGNRADPLSKILAKGSKIAVLGDLVQERWESQDGDKRSAVRILAREVVLMSGSGRQEPAPDREDETGGW